MKTKQEMIYDFMLALASNPAMTPDEFQHHVIAEMIWSQAEKLANEVLENL